MVTALSITWSALGAVLLALGFVARRRALRLAGLGLSSLLRVVSLVVLGVILIGASFAYHRLTERPT